MTPPRRRGQGRRGQRGKPKPLHLWRPVPPSPPVEPIVPASDPTALIRSLGDPPLRSEQSAYYLAAVVERAAALASALAASADLLASQEEPTD